jgi:hypothetical protein
MSAVVRATEVEGSEIGDGSKRKKEKKSDGDRIRACALKEELILNNDSNQPP